MRRRGRRVRSDVVLPGKYSSLSATARYKQSCKTKGAPRPYTDNSRLSSHKSAAIELAESGLALLECYVSITPRGWPITGRCAWCSDPRSEICMMYSMRQ